MTYLFQKLLTKFKNFPAQYLAFLWLAQSLSAQTPEIWLKAQPFLATKCQLGEGSFWDSKRQRFWFVDIESKKVHFFSWQDRKVRTFPMPSRVGTLVPARHLGGWIAGLEDGIYSFDSVGSSRTLLCVPPGLGKGQRLNDGKCDARGRFWVGGMAMEREAGPSALFSYSPQEGCRIRLDSVSIGNGIVWNQAGTRMYYVDTPTRNIRSFDYDAQTGQIGNPQTLVQVPDSLGYPDGMAIDQEERLWVAMWGGACVSVWDSKNGRWLGKISVPAPNVTSCAFSGPDQNLLIITTARQGLNPEQLRKFPESGNLFAVPLSAKGLQMPYWQ